MASRDAIVSRLVLNLPISSEERRALGAFVRRAEVVRAIERELEHKKRFPADGEGRAQIVVRGQKEILVVHHRSDGQTEEGFSTVHDAISRFIQVEIGPSCGGVRLLP